MFTQHYSPVSPHNTQTRLTLQLQKSNATLSKTGICTASKGLPICPNSAFIFTPLPPTGYYQYVNSIQAGSLNLPPTEIRTLTPVQQTCTLDSSRCCHQLQSFPFLFPVPLFPAKDSTSRDLLTGPFQPSESLENETKKDKMQV